MLSVRRVLPIAAVALALAPAIAMSGCSASPGVPAAPAASSKADTASKAQHYVNLDLFAKTVTLQEARLKAAEGLAIPDESIVGSPVKVALAPVDDAAVPRGERGVNLLYADGVLVSIAPVSSDSAPFDPRKVLPSEKARVDAWRAKGGGYDDARTAPFEILAQNGREVAYWKPGAYRASRGGPAHAAPGKVLFRTATADYEVMGPGYLAPLGVTPPKGVDPAKTPPPDAAAAIYGQEGKRVLDFVRAVR